MKLLLIKGQWRRIKQRFIKDKQQTTGEQCLKLMLRVKKMYDAKSLMVRIIRLIMKREETTKDDQLNTSAEQLSQLTGRILSLIDILQDEHRVFKRPFIIQGMDYVEKLKNEYSKLHEDFYEHYQVEFESGRSVEELS